jgi:hypothetical protein
MVFWTFVKGLADMDISADAATLGGPTMFARIGAMRVLNRHVERVFNSDHKDMHWGRRKLARGTAENKSRHRRQDHPMTAFVPHSPTMATT